MSKSENAPTPLVSVIMATYNEPPDMVASAIDSILNQTYKNFELLIFDDSTNSDTITCIDKKAQDFRVRVYRYEQRKGFVEALNEGLRLAEGKFIARMDGDDFSLPERLEKEVDFLEKHPEVSIVGGQMDIMDENSVVVSHRSYPTNGIKLWWFSCFRNPVAHPTIMMRREIIERGYYYNERLKMSEDLDLWLRLMNDGYKIENVKDTVLRYRVQSNFNDKRISQKQRDYMANVRKMNFKVTRPIHSTLSVMAGWLFLHIPTWSIKKIYNSENKKNEIIEGRKKI